MPKRDADYYSRRAKRERDLARNAAAWYAPKHMALVDHFERLAERSRRIERDLEDRQFGNGITA